MRRPIHWWVTGLVLVSFCVPAQARYQPPTCSNGFSVDQELALGKKAEAQVYQQLPVLPDANPVSQYVQQMGAKLVVNAPGYKWPFNFHVVNAADINAFALPAGAIFVNLGTIQAASTEAQLAGVMAHEISHVVLRHATCNITKAQKKSLWYGLGSITAAIGLGNGALGGLAQQGIGTIAGLDFLSMSRDAEKQADLLGTDILYDTGYDPRAMPQFFEVIQSKYGKGGAQWLSDHPNPGNRVDYVNDEIATLPRKTNYMKNAPEFKAIHAKVATMRAYSAKELQAGAWKKDPEYAKGPAGAGAPAAAAGDTLRVLSGAELTPSRSYQMFAHQQYTMSYPANWKLYGSAQGEVTVAPMGGVGRAASGGTSSQVAYGVVIDRYEPEQKGVDMATATHQLVVGLMQANSSLKQVGGEEDVRVNGRMGKSVEFTSGSPLSGNGSRIAERDWLVTIARPDGSLNYLVFVAPDGSFATLKPTFEGILRSFKVK